MTRLRLSMVVIVLAVMTLPVFADGDVLLRNWAAPPYWSSPMAADGVEGSVRAVRDSGREALALPSSALPFVAIPPCRIVDTRGAAPFTGGKYLAGESRDYQFSAAAAPCNGIPATAAAFSLNFTVTQTDGAGFLAAYPRNGRPVPLVSTLNYTGGQTIANGAVVPGDATGFITVIAGVSGTHVIVDVNGYYSGAGVVTTLNTLTGDVTLAQGSNVTITPSGQSLTIASTGGPGGVLPLGAADQTLRSNGSAWVASSLLTNNGSVIAIAGPLAVTTASGDGVLSSTAGPGNAGVKGINDNATGYGVYGISASGYGVVGQASAGNRAGVQGVNDNSGGYGVYGISASGHGVVGQSSAGGRAGVQGVNNDSGGYGVWGDTTAGTGVKGSSTTGTAISGTSTSGGWAGHFTGNVHVAGTLTKTAGSFRIDHPLDPGNKYLYHSFVESPDMKNVYDGVATTDDRGYATVELPEWFEALNRDFRYQLTVIGGGAWARARVARRIEGNRFVIETDVPATEVSWQVTGIRKDAFAEQNRIPVEEMKPEGQRGKYLHPEVHGKPTELRIDATR